MRNATFIELAVLAAMFLIDLFYRYGGHIELIRFKEYYGMPRGHEHDPIYAVSFYVRFPGNFLQVSLENGKKRSLCRVWI